MKKIPVRVKMLLVATAVLCSTCTPISAFEPATGGQLDPYLGKLEEFLKPSENEDAAPAQPDYSGQILSEIKKLRGILEPYYVRQFQSGVFYQDDEGRSLLDTPFGDYCYDESTGEWEPIIFPMPRFLQEGIESFIQQVTPLAPYATSDLYKQMEHILAYTNEILDMKGYENTEQVRAKVNDLYFTFGVIRFTDLPEGRWSYSAIMDMAKIGLFAGTSQVKDGTATFTPNGTMTRAQFITVVSKILFAEQLKGLEPGKHWYTNFYNVALDGGLFTEKEFACSELDRGISRQEMAMLLVRAAEQVSDKKVALVKPDAIADYNTVDSEYRSFVLQAFSMGLLSGYDKNGTFKPHNTLTREEGAMVIYKLINLE